jgi:tetratricopeptide (TPR) repeat protein
LRKLRSFVKLRPLPFKIGKLFAARKIEIRKTPVGLHVWGESADTLYMQRSTPTSSASGFLDPQGDHYAQGMALFHQGHYAEAVKRLLCVTTQDDLVGKLSRYYTGMSFREMGLSELRGGCYRAAEDHFRQAMNLLGTESELTGFLASALARQGRFESCSQEMEKLARHQDASSSVWRKLALAQWQSGQRDEAYMTIQRAIRQLGDVAELLLQLGSFYAAEEKMAAAREFLTRAAQADPSNADAHYTLGLVAAACQDLRLAVRSFQRAFALRPGDVLLAYQLSLAARAAAEHGFHLVVHLPDQSEAPTETTQARQLARYVATEADFIEAFLELPPSDADAELFDMLAKVLTVAVQDHAGYADLHLNLSRVLLRLGRQEDALQAGLRAAAINPKFVRALVHVARVHAAMGQPAAAMVRLHEAIAAGADYPDVHCLAAELMKDLQHPEEARRHLQRALELNDGYLRAAEALEHLAA